MSFSEFVKDYRENFWLYSAMMFRDSSLMRLWFCPFRNKREAIQYCRNKMSIKERHNFGNIRLVENNVR